MSSSIRLKTGGRRAFLKSTAAFAGLSMVESNCFSDELGNSNKAVSHEIELAVATICTDGFDHHRHQPAFELIPKTPFKNIEFNLWYPETITPQYLEGLKERCNNKGLKPVSLQGTSFGGEGRSGIIKDISHKLTLMQGCRQLGCRIVKCTGARRGTQGGLKSLIESLKELAPAAQAMGIFIVLENHANNVIERIEDYDAIFEHIDSASVGMCLDTGHFEGVGVDLHDVIDRFKEKILHVDLKDCRKRGAGHDTVLFGEGVTDFKSFLGHLIKVGYSGYLVVEQAWREPRKPIVENLNDAWRRFASYQTSVSNL